MAFYIFQRICTDALFLLPSDKPHHILEEASYFHFIDYRMETLKKAKGPLGTQTWELGFFLQAPRTLWPSASPMCLRFPFVIPRVDQTYLCHVNINYLDFIALGTINYLTNLFIDEKRGRLSYLPKVTELVISRTRIWLITLSMKLKHCLYNSAACWKNSSC